jgi:hypothetical protein
MKILLRWLCLLVILANVAFNYIYQTALQVPTMRTVSDKYESLFTPAGYAFSIWGIIYLAFIVFGIVAVLPKNRANTVYDRLCPALLLVNLAGSVWIYLFTAQRLTASVAVICLMLLFGIYLFVQSNRAVNNGQPALLTVPFSLFLGWISVATIACMATWLVSVGWQGGSLGAQLWTQLMLAAAGLVALLAVVRYNTVLLPLVVAWATLAVYRKQAGSNDAVAFTALGVCAAAVLFAIIALLTRKRRW